jgi:HPt (histidine-containing phosphotransfer) domain-containing protein
MLSIPTANVEDIQTAVPEIFGGAVDQSVLAGYEMIQLDGEPDLVIELIDLYLEDAPRRLSAMQESAAHRDWQSVKREAHSLRGSSGSVGAVEVVQTCVEIEETVFRNPDPDPAELLSRLELDLQRVRRAFLIERERRRSQ